MTLGEYVKAYREMHDLSQRKFAALTGLSNTFISNLERGRNGNGSVTTPSLETYQAIAKATGCTAQDLLDILDDEIPIQGSFSPEEIDMISLFRKASERDQKIIMSILQEYGDE